MLDMALLSSEADTAASPSSPNTAAKHGSNGNAGDEPFPMGRLPRWHLRLEQWFGPSALWLCVSARGEAGQTHSGEAEGAERWTAPAAPLAWTIRYSHYISKTAYAAWIGAAQLLLTAVLKALAAAATRHSCVARNAVALVLVAAFAAALVLPAPTPLAARGKWVLLVASTLLMGLGSLLSLVAAVLEVHFATPLLLLQNASSSQQSAGNNSASQVGQHSSPAEGGGHISLDDITFQQHPSAAGVAKAIVVVAYAVTALSAAGTVASVVRVIVNKFAHHLYQADGGLAASEWRAVGGDGGLEGPPPHPSEVLFDHSAVLSAHLLGAEGVAARSGAIAGRAGVLDALVDGSGASLSAKQQLPPPPHPFPPLPSPQSQASPPPLPPPSPPTPPVASAVKPIPIPTPAALSPHPQWGRFAGLSEAERRLVAEILGDFDVWEAEH